MSGSLLERKSKLIIRGGMEFLLDRAGLFLLILYIAHRMPEILPFNALSFWSAENIGAGIIAIWPLLLLAILSQAIVLISFHNFLHKSENEKILKECKKDIIVTGITISVVAGIVEEIVHWWAYMIIALIILDELNILSTTIFGFEIIKYLYVNVFGYLAEKMTFGYMHALLYKTSWTIGASIFIANCIFVFAHENKSPIFYYIIWMAGMFLFWLMFTYGIFVAMIAHALYNFTIHFVIYLYVAITKRVIWD